MLQPTLSLEEQVVVNHFERNHSKDKTGRFIVPLPMKNDVTPLSESMSLAVKRFKALERSFRGRSQSKEFTDAVQGYFDMGDAELVPVADLSKSCNEVYYLPMHTVRKETSFSTSPITGKTPTTNMHVAELAIAVDEGNGSKYSNGTPSQG